MNLEIPITVEFDDVWKMVEEIKSLQTYKLSEDDDMLLVNREDVADILARHVKAKNKQLDGLPSAQPEQLGTNLAEVGTEERAEERTETHACDCINRQQAIDEIDEWIKAFRENGHKESAADACLIQDGIIQLPSAQPCKQTCKSMYADVSDLVSRQAAIYAVNTALFPKINTAKDAEKALMALPSAQSSLITWLLDEIWDEEMWELNWQAFPELLCRKLEKLGYVKRTGDEYERLDR